MIITLTHNPAVDQTDWIDRLQPGAIHRVLETHIDPAGKGVNVSRIVHRLGWPTIAFGFLAGETGNLVETALQEEGVQHQFVHVPGRTRINLTVVAQSGKATSFFSPGPVVPRAAQDELEKLVRFWMQAGRVLVLAGSLPPGVPEDIYGNYVRAAREKGLQIIVDADGEALRQGIAAGPDLIKPNVTEAGRLVNRHLSNFADVLEAAREMSASVRIVVISMGKEGAVCVEGARAWHVRSPKIKRRSTVGSGDAMVAGLAVGIARRDPIEKALRLGTAAGAATAMSAGTALGTVEDIDRLLPQIHIEAL